MPNYPQILEALAYSNQILPHKEWINAAYRLAKFKNLPVNNP
jgi:hypothetical protein